MADLNPGMIIVALVQNDRALRARCPDCHKQFKAHERVFMSVDERVAIHVSCVVALALVATMQDYIPATPDGVYEHLREELLKATVRSDAMQELVAKDD